MLIDVANRETVMKRRYETRLKEREEELLGKINELRGTINQMRVDHRREVMDLLASREAVQASAGEQAAMQRLRQGCPTQLDSTYYLL